MTCPESPTEPCGCEVEVWTDGPAWTPEEVSMETRWKAGDRVRPTQKAWAWEVSADPRLRLSPATPGRVDHLTGFVWVLHDDGNLRAWLHREVEPGPPPEVDVIITLCARVGRLARELAEAQRALAAAVEDVRGPGDGDRLQGAGRMAL